MSKTRLLLGTTLIGAGVAASLFAVRVAVGDRAQAQAAVIETTARQATASAAADRRALEARVQEATEIRPLLAALKARVDGRTLVDLFDNEDWWRSNRADMTAARVVIGDAPLAARGLDLGGPRRRGREGRPPTAGGVGGRHRGQSNPGPGRRAAFRASGERTSPRAGATRHARPRLARRNTGNTRSTTPVGRRWGDGRDGPRPARDRPPQHGRWRGSGRRNRARPHLQVRHRGSPTGGHPAALDRHDDAASAGPHERRRRRPHRRILRPARLPPSSPSPRRRLPHRRLPRRPPR